MIPEGEPLLRSYRIAGAPNAFGLRCSAHEIWADGEPIAKTPATIEIVPSAVEVLLPFESGG